MHREPGPPAGASRLLSWFRDPYLPQILGDLDEEFGTRARSLGAAAARRWYWRETLRNAGVLLWRKRLIGTSFIAMLAVLTTNILFAILAEISWHVWMEAFMWKSQYRPLLYRQSWGMGWPMGFAFEILCAPIVALGVGYVFAVAAPERAKHMRIAAVVLWLLNCLWYTLFIFEWIHPRGVLFPPIAWQFKQRLLLEFLSREAVAAGAFFVGAGMAMTRRKTAVTQ